MYQSMKKSLLLGLSIATALASISYSQPNCNGNLQPPSACTNTKGGSSCKIASQAGTCGYNNQNNCTCFMSSFSGNFKYKDVVAPGASETDSYAVNKMGAVGGDYVDSSGVQHGMILVGKTVTTADRSDCQTGAGSGVAFYGLTTKRIGAGWCLNTGGTPIAFTYANGSFTDISISGSTAIEANGINDAGGVVGTYVDSSGVQHGFLLVGSQLTTLDVPGATSTTAWAINKYNWITVYGVNSSGDYISFETPDQGTTYYSVTEPSAGALGTVVHGINDNGDIDGTYFDSSNLAHGFLLNGNTFYDLDDPKASNSTRADGLNQKLEVVGRYTPSAGGNFGFSAKPVK